MKIETLAVHAGELRAQGAVTDPIVLSTTFAHPSGSLDVHGWTYGRTDNPNRAAFEGCLAALEGGEQCVAFASGMAAVSALLQTYAPGDHIIVERDCYYGLRVVLRETFERWGLECTFVDLADHSAVAAAVRPLTRLIWAETPTNPLLKVVDLAALAGIARAAGAMLACDNTFATPICQNPFDFGAEIVMHSATKFLSGHSDVLAGAIVLRGAGGIAERLRRVQRTMGAVPSPFECWLTMRGIKTLPLRVRAQSETAAAIAGFLVEHAAVERVHYPGLPGHPGHDVAVRQMRAFGGVLSFQVRGDAAAAIAVAERARLFTRATSLGGVHSLIEHRASVEPPDSTTPRNLLRLAIGLEHRDDLIEDLAAALHGA